MTTTLKFFYNGLKGADGKLQKAHYSDGELTGHPAGTVTIYARDYEHFSAEVKAVFAVENDSDIMTDYFEQDRIRVEPSHPMFAAVFAALAKQKAHREQIVAKRRAA